MTPTELRAFVAQEAKRLGLTERQVLELGIEILKNWRRT